MRSATIVAVLVVMGTALCGADTVIMTDGTIIEGKVISEDGGTVVIEIAVGRLRARQRIARGDVARIEKGKTDNEKLLDEVAQRRKRIGARNASEWYEFGKWLEGRTGFSKEAREAFRKAVQIDPRHELAWRGLGFLKDGKGEWRPEGDVMTERGFIRFDSKWVTPAEKEKIVLARRIAHQEQIAATRERMLREAEMRLAYGDRGSDSLLRRMGYSGPGYYYGGSPVMSGTYVGSRSGGSFYGTVGARRYVEAPGSSYYRSYSPGIVYERGDATWSFGSGRSGWGLGVNFSGDRGNSSWSGSFGIGGR